MSQDKYFYENLDFNRFQHLAHAVICADHPETQCLPVGQSDGGRDAFRINDVGEGGFTVYQVKFTKHPHEKTERDSIEGIIKTEKEKVITLIERGANKYVFFTNVGGTAHPDSGSIDKVNKVLTKEFGIPTFVYWRDDINARLDVHDSIKWSYTDILRASDILPILMSKIDGGKSEQRYDAVRKYISLQHRDDSEVKFKQVDLQNKLIPLFVDLPISQKFSDNVYAEFEVRGRQRIVHTRRRQSRQYRHGLLHEGMRWGKESEAATYLLNYPLEKSSKIVLEGAPGQGKSTITQYLCQVYRVLLLNHDEKRLLKKQHLVKHLRIPFRIDLRDFALWVNGRNPFAGSKPIPVAKGTVVSLENFIAHQVSSLSGGAEFNVSDFNDLLKKSHILIVLDGFDEVADIKTRKKVVTEINNSAVRMGDEDFSAQFIVTSRPAAFANSPGFDENEWDHLLLNDLTRNQIDEYTNKWMTARAFDEKDKGPFKSVLDDKLSFDHLRMLSKNPMQLAILLLLIHTRGESLPDKRTSLYNSYMELFFDREAEKSKVVSKHRDLLLNIHGFIGWVLQVQAEEGQGPGRITAEEFQSLIQAYLQKNGHKATLVDELFVGMVERVVALVSRVEGTFEFEVQPLREYFTARYLYFTAPYDPAGKMSAGTKPDRFNAIAQSFYWTNVLRFYCGFYSSGELGSLLMGLEQIGSVSDQGLIRRSNSIAIMLLSDWVFSNQPIAVSKVVDLVVRGELPTTLINESINTQVFEGLSLPDECGRDELAKKCSELLESEEPGEKRDILLDTLSLNADEQTRLVLWGLKSTKSFSRNRVFYELHRLKLLPYLDKNSISEIFESDDYYYVRSLALQGKIKEVLSNKTYKNIFFESFFDYNRPMRLSYEFSNPDSALIYSLRIILSPHSFQEMLQDCRGIPIREYLYRRARRDEANAFDVFNDTENKNFSDSGLFATIEELYSKYDGLDVDWKQSLKKWNTIVDATIESGLSKSAATPISIYAASLPLKNEKGVWTNDAWLETTGLVERLRFARLKSGNYSWWSKQIDSLQGPTTSHLCLSMCLTWSTPRALKSLKPELSDNINSLSLEEYNQLDREFRRTLSYVSGNQNTLKSSDLDQFDLDKDLRTVKLLLNRLDEEQKKKYAKKKLRDYTGNDPQLINICFVEVLEAALHSNKWNQVMRVSALACSQKVRIYKRSQRLHGWKLPTSTSREVLQNSQDHCFVLIQAALESLSPSVAKKASQVAQIASSENWFASQF